MRDFILIGLLFGSIPFILWRPTIGVFLWVWVSVMSPHRLAWGLAYDFSFAQLIAVATLVGMVFSKEPKRLPVTPVTVVLFLMALWMNVTTLFAIDTAASLPMWERVMKIQFMIFVSMYLLYSKQHVMVLIWILAGSVAFFGIKGGLFTIEKAGELRVWGPAGSFIEDNNALAVATIMTIPLLHFLWLQGSKRRVVRWGLLAAMVLCVFSALGSYSRGALVAITAMVGFLWWKSRRKFVTALVLAMLVPVAIGFMPEKWEGRMRSIQTYDQDASSLGRINAWMMAFNLANDRPLGGGFEIYNGSVFGRYAPDPTDVHAAHSIYFQMLGEHGYVGLMLFLLLWFLVWRDTSWVIRHSRNHGELQWALDLARMTQVSLVGYAVGGAFLNLAYYDVPYNLLIAMVLTRLLVEKELKGLEQNEGAPVVPQLVPQVDGGHRAVARTRFDPQMNTDNR